MREARDVKVAYVRIRRALLDLVAREEQASLVVIIGHARWLADERLLNAWHGALRLFAQDAEVDRHLAPAKEKQSALFQHFLGDRLRPRLLVGIVVWEKQEAHREIGVLIQLVSHPLQLRPKDLVRNLRGHTCAVAGLRIGVHRATMDEPAERLEPIAEHLIGALPADLRHEADAARVVFHFRTVESREASDLICDYLIHNMSP